LAKEMAQGDFPGDVQSEVKKKVVTSHSSIFRFFLHTYPKASYRILSVARDAGAKLAQGFMILMDSPT
jgi:hypothetical protein